MNATVNAELVTRVYASFTFNDVFPDVDPDQDNVNEIADFDTRVLKAYEFMAREVKFAFPNVQDLWIENTGWNGDWAQFSPRGEAEDGTPYAWFFDWLDTTTQLISM